MTAGDASPPRAGEPFLHGMVGSIVLLLAMLWLEPVLFGRGFYAGLTVHPFWVVVIIASLQGGLLIGVATAALAGALMDWPVRPLDVDVTRHYATLAIAPIEWMLSALLFGTLRQLQIAAEVAVRRENAELRDVNALVVEEAGRLDAALEYLELREATRIEDREATIRALAALGASGPDEAEERLVAAARALSDAGGAACLPGTARAVAWGGAPATAPAGAREVPTGRATVVPWRGEDGSTRFAACCGTGGGAPAGWVAIAGPDRAAAEGVAPVAEALAHAVTAAAGRWAERSCAGPLLLRPRDRVAEAPRRPLLRAVE